MVDPELRSDETILMRAPGIYAKSIPFEGILTNKRIFLIDRAKNLLPPKEIPLVTIKDVQPGQNAIGDQTLTISVMAKTGETRQMILTFSKETGGNRIRERDEWYALIKQNTSSSFDQVIRKVIPGLEQPQRKPEAVTAPRIEIVGSPITPEKKIVQRQAEEVQPVKKVIETAEPTPTSPPVQEINTVSPGLWVYCSRCGNKVPQGSAFCSRCGSPIVVPGSPAAVSPATQPPAPAVQPPFSVPAPLQPAEQETQYAEPSVAYPKIRIPSDPLQPVAGMPRATRPAPGKKPAGRGFLARLFSPKKRTPAPVAPPNPVRNEQPAPKKPKRSFRFRPGKRVIIATVLIVVIIIAAVGGFFFVMPKLTSGGTSSAESGKPSATTTTNSGSLSTSGTIVGPKETPNIAIPSTGVWVHVNYLGSWKGTYGMPQNLQTAADSGEKLYEVLNATGTVQASFAKLDSSTRHDFTLEIYKNGKVLTSGTTSAGYGTIVLSVDTTTGVAQPPQVTGGNAAVATTQTGNVTSVPTTNTTVVKTNQTATNVTVAKTTAPINTTATGH